MSSNHHNFDTVLAFNILKFTHHEEWSVIKPFLISSSFRNVFESEEFAKQYLLNWFQLSEEEINQLERFGLEFGRIWKNNSENTDEQPQKKRKMDREIVTETFSPPQTMNEILQMYTKLFYKVNLEKTKTRIIETLNNYNRGDRNSAEKISEIKKLVACMECDELIAQSFKRFGNNSLASVETKEKDFTFNRLTVQQCFGRVKEVFLLDHVVKERVTDFVTKNEIIVFTNIGYPLLLKTTFINGYSLDQSENLYIYSHELFNNQRRENMRVSQYSQTHNQELLDSLKTILLSKRANEFLIRNGVKVHQIDDVKQAMIYDFLELSFGSFNSSFRLDSLGWIPFVGKVKGDGDDYESDDSDY